MKHILVDKFNEINIELNDTQIEQFEKYYELLIEWNNVMNLTAITEKEDGPSRLKHRSGRQQYTDRRIHNQFRPRPHLPIIAVA